MIEISRYTPLIEEVPSFTTRKYGYIEDLELISISHQLFSSQSHLAYVENKENYSTFEELVKSKQVKYTDFFDYQKADLDWLMKKSIIYKDDKGYIQFQGEIVTILKDFYNNEVICLTYYKDNDALKSLISDNKIIIEGKLFSRPEQKYLNFILNDREFDNGLALRNKYLHGNNPQSSCEHENDYFLLLKIFVLIIIKINEEFCLRDDLSKDNEKKCF